MSDRVGVITDRFTVGALVGVLPFSPVPCTLERSSVGPGCVSAVSGDSSRR